MVKYGTRSSCHYIHLSIIQGEYFDGRWSVSNTPKKKRLKLTILLLNMIIITYIIYEFEREYGELLFV